MKDYYVDTIVSTFYVKINASYLFKQINKLSLSSIKKLNKKYK